MGNKNTYCTLFRSRVTYFSFLQATNIAKPFKHSDSMNIGIVGECISKLSPVHVLLKYSHLKSIKLSDIIPPSQVGGRITDRINQRLVRDIKDTIDHAIYTTNASHLSTKLMLLRQSQRSKGKQSSLVRGLVPLIARRSMHTNRSGLSCKLY